MMEVQQRHIAAALILAVLLHAGIAIAVFWTPMRSGAVGTGVGGMAVALGGAGGAPGVAAPVTPDEIEAETAETAAEIPPDAEPVEEVMPVEEATPPIVEEPVLDAVRPEPIEATAVDVTQVPPEIVDAPAETPEVEAVTPEIATVEEVAPQTAPVETVDVARVDPAETGTVTEAREPDAFEVPVPRARPREVPTIQRRVRQPRPTQQPTPERPRPSRPEPAPETPPTQQAARTGGDAAAETSDSTGQGQGGAAGNAAGAGQGQRATGGGNPGAKRDYMSRVAALLERHKRYPRRARARRQEGVGQLFFVVQASGAVGAVRLKQSTGHDLLDREILEILQRIGSLPPIPDDLGVAQLEFVVPINFDIR